jgi:hypothetical protein
LLKNKTEAVIKSQKKNKESEKEKETEKDKDKNKLTPAKKSLKTSIADKQTEEKENKKLTKNTEKNLTLDMDEIVSNFDDQIKPKEKEINILYQKIKKDNLKQNIAE